MSNYYNKFLKNVILPLGDMLNRSSVLSLLSEMKKEVTLNSDKINELQKNKLEKLIHYSLNNCKFYNGLNIKCTDDVYKTIKQFPILEKDSVRKYKEDLTIGDVKKLYPQRSSGSTGLQTEVYWSKKDLDYDRATALLWWSWAGYDVGDYILQTGITTERGLFKRFKDIVFRTYYLSAFNHSSVQVENALKWLNTKKKSVLGGYPSSLYILAEYAQKNGVKAKVKTCITWGDKLFDHYKSKIENVFSTKVYETYGSSEGFLIAAQYDLPYMYIMDNNIYLEIVDDNGDEVEDGVLGHVIVTNLNNYSMPLIRYRLGDLAIKLPEEEYPEKQLLNLPLLQKVVGRDTDIVRTPSGNLLVVHSFTGVFEHFMEIKQYQIVQNSINEIIIKIVPGEGFSNATLDSVKSRLADSISDDKLSLKFDIVDFIKSSNSGKPQMIISKLLK